MALNDKQCSAIKILKVLENLEKSELEEIRKLRKRKFWVNPFLAKRHKYDIDEHLLKDILWVENENDGYFNNFCRLNKDDFEKLLILVLPSIEKKTTKFRESISARTRLAITLRFIASGDSYHSLEYLTRVSRKTISKFICQVLNAIYDALQPKYLKMLQTEDEWTNVAKEFDSIWDFPHCLGAIDGKHIRIKCPPQSHSDFYNYKGFFSVVLLAVVNAHSKFIYIDVGSNGRVSDNVIFKSSDLYSGILSGELSLPPAQQLGKQEMKIPYYLIGDDIFGLDKHMMKAYSRCLNLDTKQEVFNYRLSRARMTVEMAFGRLVSRFRIFHRPLEVSLSCVDAIIKTCCVLHNYLTREIRTAPNVDEISIEEVPNTIAPLNNQEHSTYKHSCKIRDVISLYCITDGDVLYQWNKIRKQ